MGEVSRNCGEYIRVPFCPPLNALIPQSNDKSKKNCRDFILSNYARDDSVWKYLKKTMLIL